MRRGIIIKAENCGPEWLIAGPQGVKTGPLGVRIGPLVGFFLGLWLILVSDVPCGAAAALKAGGGKLAPHRFLGC